MKKHRKWAALLIVPALLIVGSFSAFAQSTVVSVEDGAAKKGNTDTVTLAINDVTDLGAATIWLNYNKDVVTVDSVADGDLAGVTVNIDNTTGVTKMAWFSATGQTGDFIFANVTLRAVGDYPECSDLDLDVITLRDSVNDPIVHIVDDGEFCVLEGPGPRPGPTVGGTGQMPNKPTILAPWIAGGTALAIGLGWFVLRRRKTQI